MTRRRKRYGIVCPECYAPLPVRLAEQFNILCPSCDASISIPLDSDLISDWKPPFMRRWRCADCNGFPAFYHCRRCAWRLCSVCVQWPSPRLHSPGKGLCPRCREECSRGEVKAFYHSLMF